VAVAELGLVSLVEVVAIVVFLLGAFAIGRRGR
jgi:hypothetical protein